NFVADGFENFCNYPPRRLKRKGQIAGSFLFFQRSPEGGLWSMRWLKSEDDALFAVGQYMANTSLLDLSGFYVLNIGTVTDWAMDRIFDLQEIAGNEAEVPA